MKRVLIIFISVLGIFFFPFFIPSIQAQLRDGVMIHQENPVTVGPFPSDGLLKIYYKTLSSQGNDVLEITPSSGVMTPVTLTECMLGDACPVQIGSPLNIPILAGETIQVYLRGADGLRQGRGWTAPTATSPYTCGNDLWQTGGDLQGAISIQNLIDAVNTNNQPVVAGNGIQCWENLNDVFTDTDFNDLAIVYTYEAGSVTITPTPTVSPSPTPTLFVTSTPTPTPVTCVVAPDAPQNLAPNGIEYPVGGNFALSWDPDPYADRYVIRIDDLSNPWCDPPVSECSTIAHPSCKKFSDLAGVPGDYCDDNLILSSYAPSYPFLAGHTYRWWVQSINQCGWSPSSVALISIAALVTPTPGGTSHQFTPQFVKYDLRLCPFNAPLDKRYLCLPPCDSPYLQDALDNGAQCMLPLIAAE
jgi:hypothetical protein